MEMSKKLNDDLKHLEQANIQLGSLNLQLRKELSVKSQALEEAESARRQLSECVKLLESDKKIMEEEVKEVRAHLKFTIVIKDELIGHLQIKN